MSNNLQSEIHAVAAVSAFAAPSEATLSQSPTVPANSAQRAPMRAILMVVGLAIALFLAFSSFSIHKATLGSTQLAEIKSLYFPVLERIDISVVQLDKMEEQYMLAVMAGERDPIVQAADHHGKADATLTEVVELYPVHGKEAAALEARFAKYKQQADATAASILGKTATDAAG